MPVITPAYPSMCATYNITRSAMTVIQQELQRGCDITDAIMLGRNPWSDLFVKHTFFTQGYKYYISVITSSTDKEAHKVWSGYVESKVRVLVQGLEQHQSIALAHAFNKGYERRHRCANETEVHQVQAGNMSFLVKDGEVHDTSSVKVETEAGLSNMPVLKSGPAETTLGIKEETEPADIKQEMPSAANLKAEKEDHSVPAIDVFTTTHYIGLTLSEGRFSHTILWLVVGFIWIHFQRGLHSVQS